LTNICDDLGREAVHSWTSLNDGLQKNENLQSCSIIVSNRSSTAWHRFSDIIVLIAHTAGLVFVA